MPTFGHCFRCSYKHTHTKYTQVNYQLRQEEHSLQQILWESQGFQEHQKCNSNQSILITQITNTFLSSLLTWTIIDMWWNGQGPRLTTHTVLSHQLLLQVAHPHAAQGGAGAGGWVLVMSSAIGCPITAPVLCQPGQTEHQSVAPVECVARQKQKIWTLQLGKKNNTK